jgi:serine/threonine-protein kinase
MTEAPTPLERQPLGPNVPEPMRAAIARALSKDKNERFSSVREFYDAFSGGAAPASTASPSVSGGTSMIGAAGGSAAVSQAPMSRAKTEMGAPMMAGPVSGPGPSSGAYTPPPSPAVVPAPPAHTDSGRKGGSGLVIGLGVLAVLFIGGAGLTYALSNKSKPVPVTPVDLGTPSASAVASTAAPEGDPNAAVSAAPALDSAGQKVIHAPPHENTSGGTPHNSSSAKPIPTPIPTPKPPDPPICQRARETRGKVPPKITANLEEQCRRAGGTP